MCPEDGGDVGGGCGAVSSSQGLVGERHGICLSPGSIVGEGRVYDGMGRVYNGDEETLRVVDSFGR
jgi:hypothetical protein